MVATQVAAQLRNCRFQGAQFGLTDSVENAKRILERIDER